MVELMSIKIRCSGKTKLVSEKDLIWGGSSDECDMCGSHGSVTVDFRCPICGKNHTIEVDGW
jgi:rubrerythrin